MQSEISRTASIHPINERSRIIGNIHSLGREIADSISRRQRLIKKTPYHVANVYTEESYRRRRFFFWWITETRTRQESRTLIRVMTSPPIWLTLDGKFTQRRQQNNMYTIKLEELQTITLQSLERQMQTFSLNLFSK